MQTRTLIGFMIGMLTVSLLSFTGSQSELNKSSAQVEQSDGLYIFHQAKPISEYQILGTVELSEVITSNARLFMGHEANLIRKAKKRYPQADGLIVEENGWQADGIKFN